ncbi:hypothetical protein HXX25_06730 [Hyphobacterium sp. CCMP332]|uniref:DUF6491 family protein n=1 Tax=Hyphobacterium sp. CCMP332 TaxID=2749086 RepID=UPI00164FBB64|nr:DUF6491 family protein [Hyphobacterium sp. CCMP332]QNL19041.1 hypothetical protein HXX25_06730 [Hyphobacterium sp. CCMP332]
MKYLTIASLALCASAAAPAMAIDHHGNEEEGTPRCVRLVQINGYSVIDREHVVFRGGASRHYLATLRHRCPDLNFGVQLATSFGENATLCPPVVEYITPDNGFRCAIDTVEEVDSVEAARALIEARAEIEAQSDDHE